MNSCYSAQVFTNTEVLGFLPGFGVMTLLVLDGFYVCLMCNFIKTFNESRQLNFKTPASNTQKLTTTQNQSSPEIIITSKYMHEDNEIVVTDSQTANKSEVLDTGLCSYRNEVVKVNTLEHRDITLNINANSKQSAIAGTAILSTYEGGCTECDLQYNVVKEDVRQHEHLEDNAFQRSHALQKSAMIHIAIALVTVNVTILAALAFTIFILLHKFEVSPKVLDTNLIILTVPSVLTPFIYGFQVRELRGTVKGHLTRLERLIGGLFKCRG